MCGIAGMYYYRSPNRVDETTLTRMRDTMIHRGPDGAGNWISDTGHIGLAHRRLSIIDLSTSAAQPMSNQEQTIWVTFNGEIYNHLALRSELKEAGYQFQTDHSDTEVLVHGYRQWGIDKLLSKLEGDYGFALWDTLEESLYLVRDRVGVKPLYFTTQQGMIAFASEIKALVVHPDVERDIDPIAMGHYLSFLTTPAPLTMFKGIYKLPAGHYLHINKAGKYKATQYWEPFPESDLSSEIITASNSQDIEKQYITNIRERLSNAVDKRMMSDVPLGVFLSGGIDSSTNVALMSRSMSRPVDTFTVGFSDHQHLNELEYARQVAKKFKTNHHEVMISESDMRGYLADLIHHQDEPIADWVCIPLYFVSKLAKDNGMTVIQVGEGADEQFCGYASYMGYLDLYKKYWQPFQTYLPRILQRLIAKSALFAADLRPSLEVYADIVDRAARQREHFWSGATTFWDIMKNQLIVPGSLQSSDVPAEMRESGLLSEGVLSTDTFNVIQTFNQAAESMRPNHDVLARMIYNEFKLRLPELLLMRVDKITMSVSLEARVPFLDHDMVELTMDIPMDYKVRGNRAKHLLKEAVRGLIPDEIIDRKKMGFGAPMSQWLRGDFGEYVSKSIMSSKLLERGYLDVGYINQLIEDHRSGRRDTSLYIWTLFNMTAWFDYWVDGVSK